jgi:hypothetical protein
MSDTLRETLRRIPRRLDSPYVFPGKLGKELVNIRRRFLKALDEAGIEGFVFHGIRHTFASHLVMAGVDLMTVKEFLGHKRFEMTLRYAHLAPDHKKGRNQSTGHLYGHRTKRKGHDIRRNPLIVIGSPNGNTTFLEDVYFYEYEGVLQVAVA